MSKKKQWSSGAIIVLHEHVEAEHEAADNEGMPERLQTLKFVDDLLDWMAEQPITDRVTLGEVIYGLNTMKIVEGDPAQRDRIVRLLNILGRY